MAAACVLVTGLGPQVGAGETAIKGTSPSAKALLTPDWEQLATGARDVAVSHDGQRWYVGADGRAYRWLAANQSWVVHGTRSDLVRIDADKEGAAALSKDGELYVTSPDLRDNWRPTGMRARDVGLGGGMLWLADARLPGGGAAVLGSRFDATAKAFAWKEIPGRLERLDVDPAGRPWGLDKEGRLYVFAEPRWVEDTRAPAGADVGVGGRGALLLVGKAFDDALGGGPLYQRNPASGEWSALPGRLSAVSADPDGRVVGVNTLSWLLGSSRFAALDLSKDKPPVADKKPEPNKPEPKTDTKPDIPEEPPAELTLATLAGDDGTLPETIASAPVARLQGDPEKGVFIGETRLNGLKTTVARYTPAKGKAANILLWHERLTVGDYVPDLRSTQFRDITLSNAIISFVPEVNAGLRPVAADAATLSRVLLHSDLTDHAPVAGTTLTGLMDLKDHNAAALSTALGLGSSKILLTAGKVDAALFAEVVPGPRAVAAATPATTLETLKKKYGAALINSLVFSAPAKALDKKRFGPATINAPNWRFAIAKGEDEAGSGDAGIGFEIAFDADLSLEVRVPVPQSPSAPSASSVPSAPATPAANAKSPTSPKLAAPAPEFKPETISLKGTRVVYSPRQRRLTFASTLTREKATSLVSYSGFELEPAALAGSLTLAEKLAEKSGIAKLAGLEMSATTKGKMPSRAGGTEKPSANVSIELALDEDSQTLTPTLIAEGGLTLRDIVGNMAVVPDVALTRFEISPTTLSGTAELYGLPVKAVRYKTAEMPEAIVALYHQKLDLGSYVPKIREFSLGSFGMTNTVLFALPDSATQSLSFAKDKLPEPLLALLDRERIKDEDLFPLVIKPGVNLIGMYEKNPGGAKTNLVPGQATEGAGKVMGAYGIEGDAYVVKANFKTSALSKARFTAGSGGGTGGGAGGGGGGTSTRSLASDAACGVVSVADKAERSGLELSFSLPGFKPPYAGNTISFSQARFSLKDIDGQLEPEIITGLNLKLPTTIKSKLPGTTQTVAATNNSGIREIAMAGKLRLRGDLTQLCNRPTRDSNLQVEIAASSALNLTQADTTAFSALARVTEGVPVSQAPTSATGSAKPPSMGWQKPFGIPFLSINQFALAGSFAQQDKARGLTASVWTESRMGTQTLDILGRLTLEAEADQADLSLKDWLLKVPGPVQLTGLPGVDRLSQRTPFVTLSDISVRDLELTPAQFEGKLSSATHKFTGNLLLQTPETGDVSLFAAVDGFSPNMLLAPPSPTPKLSPEVNELTKGKYVFAVRSGATTSTRLGDLPEAVAEMYASVVGDLITPETSLPLVRGLSAATKLDPSGIPEQPQYADFKRLLRSLDLTQPMPLLAGMEVGTQVGAGGTAAGGTPRGFIEAWIPNFTVPGATQLNLSFSNSRISLNNTDGKTVRVLTDVRYQPPSALASTLGNVLDMQGYVESSRQATGDADYTLSATSNIKWTGPFTFPGLELGNLGIDVISSKKNGQTTRTLMVGADASFRGIEARARMGHSSDGSNTGGNLIELIARKDGDLLDLDKLLDPLTLLPANYSPVTLSSFLNLQAKGVLIASEVGSGRISLAAEDVTGQINNNAFTGQLAVVGVTTSAPLLFIHSAEPLKPLKFLPVPMGPFADLTLPKGLVVLSAANADSNLSSLHPSIYEKVFNELFGAKDAATHVLTNAGLTVVGKLNLATALPSQFSAVTSWLPLSGETIVGGGIENGRVAFYADVEGLSLAIPPPINSLVKSTSGNVTVFFKTAGSGGAGGEVGVSTDAVLNMPRLDTGALQEVPTQLSVSVQANPGASPSFAIAAKATGEWNTPLGLEDFSFVDAELALGSNAAGVTLGLHTEKARFKSREFLLDLDTAWAGAAPTQLAVQFTRSASMTDDLVLTPAIQAELIGSLFKLALKSGSKLGDEVRKQLPGNMQTVFTGLVNAMGTGANGALAVVNNSPMAMIGIKNPVVYFGTPGSAPPRRADMEAPPFGLGLLLKGQLIFDAGNGIPTLEIANGVAKVNLSDGFYLSGSVTPPAPFASSAMTLSASQSLTSPVPNLTFTGPLGLPGMTIPVINKSAGMDGSFSVTKTSGGANISAGVTIASILSRTVSMNINGGTMHVYSNPGGCVDVPLKIDGHIPMSGPPNPTQWLTFFQPYVPDVVGCLTDLGKEVAKVAEAVGKGIGEGAVYVGNQIATGGKKAYKWASKAFGGNSPARPVYDCTEAGLDSDETAIAYPPGRIWGGRDEYTRGASSGAWARYIFSEKTGKFHPFGAKGALGANACGLVGEEGATGNRIWDMALMCHTIPESMKGPGFYTIEQCYELRGLSGPPKPEHVGKVLSAAPGWWYLAGNDGKLHHVRDAAMLEACWQKPEHIIGITLDEIYRMPTGSPITNGNECLRLAAGPNRREFRGLMIQGNGPAWYLVGREGKRHWLPNFDVVDGCGPWRQGNRSPVQLGDAINFFEEGPGLPSGQDCWGKQTVDHINWATSARAAQKLLDDNKRALEQALALANAVPNRCQQLADENGIGDKVGWGWAPQSVRDEWWNKACGTKYGKKMYGGDVKRVCPAFRQRFGIIDNKTWGTAQDREVQNTYINFGCKAGV